MQEQNLSKTTPMRIGEILDRSFKLATKAIKQFPVLFLLIVGLTTTMLASQLIYQPPKDDLLLFMGYYLIYYVILFIVSIISWYYFFCVIFASSDTWLGKENDKLSIRSRITFGLFGRLIGLKCTVWAITLLYFLLGIITMAIISGIIASITFAGALKGLFTVIAIMIGAIPAIGYYINRSLALFALLLENTNIHDALKKSKALMTHRPDLRWYSPKTPLMRISGILLIMTIISIIPAVLTGTGVVLGKANGLNFATGIGIALFSQTIAIAVNTLGSVALIGFYYDLRTRKDGLDIEQELQALSNK